MRYAVKTAEDCLVKGLKISAKDAFLRTSTYYYAAMDFPDEAGQESRFTELFSIHRACWHQAAQLMSFDYETFDIPYEGSTIKGLLMRHKGDHSPGPLCIFNNGSDGSILDVWTMGGVGFFERGYNLLTFDDSGQMLPFANAPTTSEMPSSVCISILPVRFYV